jgi:hypothetical protein
MAFVGSDMWKSNVPVPPSLNLERASACFLAMGLVPTKFSMSDALPLPLTLRSSTVCASSGITATAFVTLTLSDSPDCGLHHRARIDKVGRRVDVLRDRPILAVAQGEIVDISMPFEIGPHCDGTANWRDCRAPILNPRLACPPRMLDRAKRWPGAPSNRWARTVSLRKYPRVLGPHKHLGTDGCHPPEAALRLAHCRHNPRLRNPCSRCRCGTHRHRARKRNRRRNCSSRRVAEGMRKIDRGGLRRNFQRDRFCIAAHLSMQMIHTRQLADGCDAQIVEAALQRLKPDAAVQCNAA